MERERTGAGKGVKLSLFDVIADWMSVPLLQHDYTGAGPSRVGLAHPSIAPYGGFVTGDGTTLVICVQNDREWRDLAEQVMDVPNWRGMRDSRPTRTGWRGGKKWTTWSARSSRRIRTAT